MSTAIVFASKYGSTAGIAHRIAEGLGPDTELFDLAAGRPDVSDFDTVVLGTAIYAGTPMSTMKEFAQVTGLDDKRVALFVGGMETDPAKREQEIKDAFPTELVERALTVAFLGGRFRFGKMNAGERFLIKRIAKTKTDVDAIDVEAIEEFVRLVSAERPPQR